MPSDRILAGSDSGKRWQFACARSNRREATFDDGSVSGHRDAEASIEEEGHDRDLYFFVGPCGLPSTDVVAHEDATGSRGPGAAKGIQCNGAHQRIARHAL